MLAHWAHTRVLARVGESGALAAGEKRARAAARLAQMSAWVLAAWVESGVAFLCQCALSGVALATVLERQGHVEIADKRLAIDTL